MRCVINNFSSSPHTHWEVLLAKSNKVGGPGSFARYGLKKPITRINTVVWLQRLILSHLFWLPAFLQQLLMRKTNTGRIGDKQNVAARGHSKGRARWLITGRLTVVRKDLSEIQRSTSSLSPGFRTRFPKPESTECVCNEYISCWSFFLRKLTCIRILCPSSGSSKSSSMSISNSGISSSWKKGMRKKNSSQSERSRWSFPTSGSNFRLVAYGWKSPFCGACVEWFRGEERKCVRRDPACDATRQESGCGHARRSPCTVVWCERLRDPGVKGGLRRFTGWANGGGCIVVKLGMNAVLPAVLIPP